jgi:hypothetical protein
MQELERVALAEDLQEHGLKTGDIGMIVHVYGAHKGYEVEFVTLSGELVALVSVHPHQIRQIAHNEIASVRRLQSALK